MIILSSWRNNTNRKENDYMYEVRVETLETDRIAVFSGTLQECIQDFRNRVIMAQQMNEDDIIITVTDKNGKIIYDYVIR